MCCKLAFRNVRRSLKDYFVYFLTLTFGVCIFYVFGSMDAQQALTLSLIHIFRRAGAAPGLTGWLYPVKGPVFGPFFCSPFSFTGIGKIFLRPQKIP